MPKITKKGLPKSQRRTKRPKRKMKNDVGFPSVFLTPTGTIDSSVFDPNKTLRRRRKRIKI
jgi:hypothetical protein